MTKLKTFYFQNWRCFCYKVFLSIFKLLWGKKYFKLCSYCEIEAPLQNGFNGQLTFFYSFNCLPHTTENDICLSKGGILTNMCGSILRINVLCWFAIKTVLIKAVDMAKSMLVKKWVMNLEFCYCSLRIPLACTASTHDPTTALF